MSRPETRHAIQREAPRIVRISATPAFLMMTCQRGTREADPHSGRVPPKLGGACAQQRLVDAPLNYPVCAPTV